MLIYIYIYICMHVCIFVPQGEKVQETAYYKKGPAIHKI